MLSVWLLISQKGRVEMSHRKNHETLASSWVPKNVFRKYIWSWISRWYEMKYRRFQSLCDNTQWIQVKQMQPVWLCIVSGRQLEDTFENAQWRKATQMHLLLPSILSCKQFESTFDITQWRKLKYMRPMCYTSSIQDFLRIHLNSHSGEKPNKRMQCAVRSKTLSPSRDAWQNKAWCHL